MSRLQRWGFKSSAGTSSQGSGAGGGGLASPGAGVDGANGVNGEGQYEGEGSEEKYFGLENFGNTCYCNSVLQALYHCPAFRQSIASFPEPPPPLIPIGPTPEQIKETTAQLAASQALSTQTDGGVAGSPIAPNGASFAGGPGGAAGDAERKTTPTPKRTWSMAGRKQSSNVVQQANGGGMAGSMPLKSPGPASLNTASGGWPASPNQPPTPGGVPFPSAGQPQQAPPPSAAATAIASGPPPTMLSSLQTLFAYIGASPAHPPAAAKPVQPGQTSGGPVALGPHSLAPRGGGAHGAGTLGRGVARPDELVRTVRRENELFRSTMHQDAHEFLGWLLNKVAEDVEALQREGQYGAGSKAGANGAEHAAALGKTFIHTLFEGVLTNETRCLTCETTSSRDEAFLDLSIDIEQNSSVTACLRQFSASEMLCQKNKFFCDTCCGLQEAEKRMKIRKLPNVLALHLKRFKYQEQVQRYIKLSYRVVFPFQLRLFNTSDDVADPDRLYELFAVVVHIGIGPHHGHYVAIVRTEGRWILCDDENIEPIEEADIPRYFGDYPAGSGYVLFYQAVDMDLASMGLKTEVPAPASAPAPSESDLMTPVAENEELLTSEPDEAVFAAGALSPAGINMDPLPQPNEMDSPGRRLSSPSSSLAPMPRTDARQRQDSAPAEVGLTGFSSNAPARTPSLSPQLGRYSTPPQAPATDSGRSQDSSVRRFSTPPLQSQVDGGKSKESGGNWFSRNKSSKDKDKESGSKRSSVLGIPTGRRDDSYFPTASATQPRPLQRRPTESSMADSASDAGTGLGLTVKSLGYGGAVTSGDPTAPRPTDTDTGTPSMSASFMSSASGASNGYYQPPASGSPITPSPAVGASVPQGARPGLSTSTTFSGLAGLGRKSKGKEDESPRDRVPSGSSLTRKLSVGMPGRASLTRSSSAAFKSMGFGKKKDKNADKTRLEESEESMGLMGRD